jgi:hypothetical protein
MMRVQVCSQLLLALASVVILGSESHVTHDHNLLSQIHASPILEAMSSYLYPPRTGWSSYTRRHWTSFLSPLTACRATVKAFEPTSTMGLNCNS